MVGRFNIEERSARSMPATWGFIGQAPGRAWAGRRKKCACTEKCACTKKTLIITFIAVIVVIIIAGVVGAYLYHKRDVGFVEPEKKDFTLQFSFKIDEEGKEPFLVVQQQRIFDLSGRDIRVQQKVHWDRIEMESMSVTEYAEQVSHKVTVSGTYGAFSGAAQVSTDRVLKTTRHIYRQDDTQVSTLRVAKLNDEAQDFHPAQLLTQNAKKILLEEPPDSIHSKLGDFYATKLDLGGLFEYVLMAERASREDKTEVDTKVKAKYGLPAANIAGEWERGRKEQMIDKEFKSVAKWKALGGDTKKWLGLTKNNLEQIKKEWADSFDPGNVEPVGFKLHPIWELLEHPEMKEKDPVKADKLRVYITSQWEDATRKVRKGEDIDWSIRANWDSRLCLSLEGNGRDFRLKDCNRDDDSQQFLFQDNKLSVKSSPKKCIRASREDWDVRTMNNVWHEDCDRVEEADKEWAIVGNSFQLKHNPDWCLSIHKKRLICREDYCHQLRYHWFN